jgi:hypothetical protein
MNRRRTSGSESKLPLGPFQIHQEEIESLIEVLEAATVQSDEPVPLEEREVVLTATDRRRREYQTDDIMALRQVPGLVRSISVRQGGLVNALTITIDRAGDSKVSKWGHEPLSLIEEQAALRVGEIMKESRRALWWGMQPWEWGCLAAALWFAFAIALSRVHHYVWISAGLGAAFALCLVITALLMFHGATQIRTRRRSETTAGQRVRDLTGIILGTVVLSGAVAVVALALTTR